MVGTLVRLKLTVVRRVWRRHRVLATVLLVLGSVMLVNAFAVLAVSGSDATRPDLVIVTYAGVLLAWVASPFYGLSDETVDPALLAPLPIPPGGLVRGLLVAGLVGVFPLGTVFLLGGALVGLEVEGIWLLVAAGAVATHVVLAVAAARGVAVIASVAMRARRAWSSTVQVLVAAVPLGGLVVVRATSTADLADAADVVGWTPLGVAGRAVVAAGERDAVAALAALTAAVMVTVATIVAWRFLLARALTDASSPIRAESRSGARRPDTARPQPASRSHRRTVVEKELRTFRRDRRRRLEIVVSVFAYLVVVLSAAEVQGSPAGALVLAGVVGALAGGRAVQQFSYQGRAHWLDAMTGVPARSLIEGKNLALAVVDAPAVLIAVTVLTLRSGEGWLMFPLALVVALTASVVSSSVSTMASVTRPIPYPETPTALRAMRADAVPRFVTSLFSWVWSTGIRVLPLLVAVAAAYESGSPGVVAVVLGGTAAVGWWIHRRAVRRAAGYLDGHWPELLAAVSQR